ncbi:hypothetical protein ACQE32_07140 [Pantoea sp. FN0302]|uniref:hypothetical protein n=1 Tax=Pantoea sp. FN0302 TaxID=3418558 RepID=UPI003CF4BCCE
MKPFNEKISNLLILFVACILGVTVNSLCIALSTDVLVLILTGSFDLKKAGIFKTIKNGCVIGTFTGVVFVIARLFKLKRF